MTTPPPDTDEFPPIATEPTTEELTATDVETYTGGRLSAGDPETQRMLDAALMAARREVGWHVSPVLATTLTLDGPGGRKLILPTLKIVTLTSITNDGDSVDLTTVTPSAQCGWLLYLTQGSWSWKYSGITIEFDHGFSADEAPDWRQAILTMVNQMVELVVTGRPDADLSSKQVDDITYKWGAAQALPGAAPILDKYQLPYRGFG
jgi:hypothetical protein